MPLSPQMRYPWLPGRNYVDPDSMLGLDPRLLPRTPGYDPSKSSAGDDPTLTAGRRNPGGGGGSGGGPTLPSVRPPITPPVDRGVPGQEHVPILTPPTMHQGPVRLTRPAYGQSQTPATGGGGGGGGVITPPTISSGMGSGGGGGGPISGGGGPPSDPGTGPIDPRSLPTITSSIGGSGGPIGGTPPVPGPISIPIPTLPPGIGGGPPAGPTGGGEGGGGGGAKFEDDDDDWDEMARGGVVTKPRRVVLGEQGPEAVVKMKYGQERPENFEVGERPMTYLRRAGR